MLGLFNRSKGDIQPQQQPSAGDVAIIATGGLGDYIVIARFLRDLFSKLPGVVFDIYTNNPEIAEWIFRPLGLPLGGFRYSLHDGLFDESKHKYRYAFRLNQMAYVELRPTSFSEMSLEPYDNRLQSLCDKISRMLEKLGPIADNHPRLDGALGRYAVLKGVRRYDFLHYMCGVRYGGDRLPVEVNLETLSDLGVSEDPYITVHTGFDESMASRGKFSTKVFPKWDLVLKQLKAHGMTHKVIQLGTSRTSLELGNVDLSLIDKTSIMQAAAVIKGASLHLDSEGGFVHLASCFGVKSCVIFGPTSYEYFSYPSNINFKPRRCGDCWWIEPTWMSVCPKGDTEPVCMASHSVEDIAEHVEGCLSQAGSSSC